MAKQRYLKDLRADIAKGAVSPVYVFVGASPEEVGPVLDTLRRAVLQPGFESFDEAEFDGAEVSGADIVTAARMGAMGGRGRLIVLNNPGALEPADRQEVVRYLRNPTEGNCLVVRVAEEERDGAFARAGLERGATFGFGLPKWAKKGDLIRKSLERLGLRAEGGAMAILESMLPTESGAMNRELEKLSLSLEGGGRVTAGDLTDLLMGRRGGPFELGDRLLDRDVAGALRVLDTLLQQGEEPPALLGQIARQYRLVLAQKRLRSQAADGDVPRETRGLPEAVRKRIEQATGRYREEELLESLRRVKRADRLLKSTPLPAVMVLQSLIAGLLRPEGADAA